jgi:YfiH family protein
MASSPAGEHFAVELPGARVVFTTRRGGVSRPPYDALNLGLLTDDDRGAVLANRDRLARELGVAFAYGRQVHGCGVLVADRANDPELEPAEADAVVTDADGVGAMVLTADCVPIAIARAGAVAMVHAGWQGLARGVIAAAASALGTPHRGGPMAAAIGPSAGPCCYEVGDELRARFAEYGPEVWNGRRLDLWAIARRQLATAGVATVHELGLCTICSSAEMFFSHRRDGGVTGRQAGIAWLS